MTHPLSSFVCGWVWVGGVWVEWGGCLISLRVCVCLCMCMCVCMCVCVCVCVCVCWGGGGRLRSLGLRCMYRWCWCGFFANVLQKWYEFRTKFVPSLYEHRRWLVGHEAYDRWRHGPRSHRVWHCHIYAFVVPHEGKVINCVATSGLTSQNLGVKRMASSLRPLECVTMVASSTFGACASIGSCRPPSSRGWCPKFGRL